MATDCTSFSRNRRAKSSTSAGVTGFAIVPSESTRSSTEKVSSRGTNGAGNSIKGSYMS